MENQNFSIFTEENRTDASQFIASSVASALNGSKWVSKDHKVRFCILFMQRMLERQLENYSTIQVFNKMKKKPLAFIIRLLKRYPEKGMHILSQTIIDELQQNQHFKFDQMVQFQTILLELLFPPEQPQ